MLSSQILSSSSSTTHRLLTTHNLCSITIKVPSCSLRLQEASIDEPLKSESKPKPNLKDVIESMTRNGDDEEDKGGVSISRIQVPRQRYIPIPKAELLDAIVSTMFNSQDDDRDQFLLISSSLDSILHAEHKSILEEMRNDYFFRADSMDRDEVSVTSTSQESNLAQVEAELKKSDSISNTINGIDSFLNDESEEEEIEWDNSSPFINGLESLDFWNILGSSAKDVKSDSADKQSRLAVATRFQRAFMQLLYDAQFEELSATDLMLTSALNTDYLLTLPIYVDWKRASESNAIIFRRGYTTERQKGLLIAEKLDYLQSIFLQRIFFIVSKPLEKVGNLISEAFKKASQTEEVQDLIKRIQLSLKEISLFRQSYFSNEQTSDNLVGIDKISDSELPIWLAAQRAVTRYEGFLSPVGPRERLLRKLLTWIGLTPPTPEAPFQLETSSNASEPYLRPTFLSRMSLSDIWRPATRKYCGNDVWKMLKTSVSILLSQSILQEPAFQELILLYTSDVDEKETEDNAKVPSLQLKIYEGIPIPDLAVIFPHKKLSFRIIDTVRLDIATILGLLAYFINYKFADISSSPSAIFLDVIPITALILYASRVALGYKQTRDRYQLLVNKTLYEKTLASGFGSVHFLLDASEQQQYKEAILTYAILLKEDKSQVTCRRTIADKCEKFIYDVFKEKVEMPVDKAVDMLLRLGMVTETSVDGRFSLQATLCPMAYEALKERWCSLLG